jgi:deazaflavin-dependent oxidoreductase (nitroreductase family)
MTNMNQKIIEEFRANNGKVGGFFEKMDLLLLHTTGAKSGQPRLNPTAYIKDGDRLVIAASKAGADNHPDWYFNIKADSDVIIEVGSDKFKGTAEITKEPERTSLYTELKSIYPGFADYEKKTNRVIPVIRISRV